MLKSKSFIVYGQTKTINGQRVKDIADNVDAVINGFLNENDGKYVDLKTDIKVNQHGEDVGFVTVVLDISKSEVKEKEPEEVISKKKK